ncbi:MAG TPA: FAD-binding oxidoreductase [Gemmatimonadales bacterium]|jgi:FAD/FMN-containing dehydrogenase
MTADFELDRDLETRARYAQGGGIYRIVPAAVAHPTTARELALALDQAAASGLTVTPRGAGSAMSGDNVTDGVILDLSGYDPSRCQIDPDEQMAIVSPALPLAALNRAASFYRLQLPVDPSSAAWATLGGMVSTNASGPHTVRDGSMRAWVMALTLLTGDGPLALVRGHAPPADHPVVRRWQATVAPMLARHAAEIAGRFPGVRKNTAGFRLDEIVRSGDLIDAVIGSEGTLGVITDVMVRLAPVPDQRLALRVAVRERSDLVKVIELIRAFAPATLELLDRTFLRLVADRIATPEQPGLLLAAAGLLLVELEGDADDVQLRAAALVEALVPLVLDVRLAADPADAAQLWALRHAASPILAGLTDGRRSLQVIEDGCVPVARLGDYLDAVEQAAAAQRIDLVMFGHAGDGHVHVNLLPNLQDADWLPRVAAIYRDVSRAVMALGGTPSGEHGAGRLRASLLRELYGDVVMECCAAVKAAFDPTGRFNPGVILPDERPPLERLKVGPGAAELPAGTAEYLLAVEAGARWGESRWMATPSR